MKNRTLVIDLALVGLLVALVLTLSPGLAVVAIIAILVLLLCGASFAIGQLRSRNARRRRH